MKFRKKNTESASHMKVAGLILALSAFAATTAWGQCATGVNTGGGNCVPPDAAGMPDYNPGNVSAPSSPPPVWQDKWGAIALDKDAGDAGTITDRDSKATAVHDAMSDCRARGATGCKVVLTYYNQCAAVAWSDDSYGASTDKTIEASESGALSACSKSGTGCKIVYSACSLPQRIR